MRKAFKQRLALLIKNAPQIVVDLKTFDRKWGHTEEYMLNAAGLTPLDLRKLEHAGCAMRGYMRRHFSGWKPRRFYKRGKYKKRYTFPQGPKHRGFQTVWVLLQERITPWENPSETKAQDVKEN